MLRRNATLTIPVRIQDPQPQRFGECRDLHGPRSRLPSPARRFAERIQAYNSTYTARFGNRLGGRILIRPDPFLNARGVILSYFEEVVNVMHIPFGRMERRRRERRNLQNAQALEDMANKKVPPTSATTSRRAAAARSFSSAFARLRLCAALTTAPRRTARLCADQGSERARIIPL